MGLLALRQVPLIIKRWLQFVSYHVDGLHSLGQAVGGRGGGRGRLLQVARRQLAHSFSAAARRHRVVRCFGLQLLLLHLLHSALYFFHLLQKQHYA